MDDSPRLAERMNEKSFVGDRKRLILALRASSLLPRRRIIYHFHVLAVHKGNCGERDGAVLRERILQVLHWNALLFDDLDFLDGVYEYPAIRLADKNFSSRVDKYKPAAGKSQVVESDADLEDGCWLCGVKELLK